MTGEQTLESLLESAPDLLVRYSRGLSDLSFRVTKKQAKEFRIMNVTILWGVPGCGKTRLAVHSASLREMDYFILDKLTGDALWFDGYDGEETLIIDDFYGWISHSQILRILDGYMYRAAIKGSFRWALWKTVILTSNRHPKEWYKTFEWNDLHDNGLPRRIHHIGKCQSSAIVGGSKVVITWEKGGLGWELEYKFINN